MPWDPAQYESYADARLRPALDLLARIPLDTPARVADLGCGSGNVTLRLAERWPAARIFGFDNSEEMLARARARSVAIEWRHADLAAWQPEGRYDVIYSNAALHWLDGHAALFRRLMGAVEPGGALAVQMPHNFSAPSHALAYELAEQAPFAEFLAAGLRRRPVLDAAEYHALLSPLAAHVDVWETEYTQSLPGEDAVAGWMRGTFLVPLLDALPHALRGEFESSYKKRVANVYRKSADGKTLFPFRRIFMVAIARQP